MKDKPKSDKKDNEKPHKMKKKTLDKKSREFRRSHKPKSADSSGVDTLEDDELATVADDAESPAVDEIVVSRPKTAKGKRGAVAKDGDALPNKNGGDPSKPQTRLSLIRARHESMRREIDQIREDLESDEEE